MILVPMVVEVPSSCLLFVVVLFCLFDMFCFLSDVKMARLAITPSSDLQMAAVIWLNDYFSVYGDHHPNDEQISMSVPTKKEVWQAYKTEHTSIAQPFVTQSNFNALWLAIYPQYMLKPFISVAATCDTCYKIDTARKSTTDPNVKEALKQCHHLHRGGMFMPERRM